jgi:hypothetical protein
MFFFFSSCIKEDLTDCPLPLQVVFSYEDDGTGLNAITQNDLKEATLFVFDENENLVTSWSVSNPILGSIYQPDIELVPKKYHFVVWFNLSYPYSYTPNLSGNPTEDEMAFHLDIPAIRRIDESETFSLPVSLYGYQEDVIKEARVNTVTIPLVQNSNVINLTVSGLTPTTDDYRFSIKDNNANYNFDNEIIACDDFDYTQVVSFSPASNTLNASLTVMKLAADHRHPVIAIEQAGETLFPKRELDKNNLIDLILARYPDNDFNKRHVYNIEIVFTTDMSVSIIVDGWNVVTNGSDNVEIIPD